MSGDPSASFAINLEDGTSAAADSAADSLETLRDAITADVKALAEMKRAMRNLKGETSTSSKTFLDLKDKITAQKAVVAQSQAKYLDLGGTFGKIKAPAAGATKSVASFGDTLAGTSGPLGTLGGGLARLKGLLFNPIAGALALAASLIGLAVAAGKAGIAILKYTIAQSSARRAEAARIDGLNTLSEAYGRSTASADQHQAAMDRAADSTNVNRGRLSEFTRQLARTGLRGEALSQATEAMALAQQVQGDRGAARFRAMAHNIRLTGGDVRDLSDRFRNELGPIADRQMRSLGNQSDRLSRSVSQIFSGLELDPIEESFASIVDLFSQSSVTGRALKQIVESMLQPVIDQADDATPMLVDMFEKGVLGGLLFAIKIQDLRIKFAEFSNAVDESREQIGNFFSALLSGDVSAIGEAIAGQKPSVRRAGAEMGEAVREGFESVLQIRSPSRVFRGFGENIAAGVVNGMRDARSEVARASEAMADTTSNAFRNKLQIRSPSRVFAGYGGDIADGVSEGVDGGAKRVRRAIRDVVDVPDVPSLRSPPGAAAEDRASATTNKNTSTVSFSFGDIVIEDKGNAADNAKSIREELMQILAGVSVEMGVPT